MIPRYSPTYSLSDLFRSWRIHHLPELQETLRARLSALYGVRHVYLLHTASAALYVLLKAYNQPGGVLTSAYNDLVVPESICFAGYQPVFADIDYNTLQLDPESVEADHLKNVTVIVPVHLFGVPCLWEKIGRIQVQTHALVIEDVAPAFGATHHGLMAGTRGDAAIISFHHTKVISAELGGVLITNDDQLAQKLEKILQNVPPAQDDLRLFIQALVRKILTWRAVYPITFAAYRTLFDECMTQSVRPDPAPHKNYLTRCSNFSAALILSQLGRLPWNLARRRRIAEIYRAQLAGLPGITIPGIPEDCAPAWIHFPIFLDNKGDFYKYMQRKGIDLSWTWRYSCSESFGLEGFPNTKKATQTLLGLPTYPSLTDNDARWICAVIRKYSENRR